jgi:hypothetical protein
MIVTDVFDECLEFIVRWVTLQLLDELIHGVRRLQGNELAVAMSHYKPPLTSIIP